MNSYHINIFYSVDDEGYIADIPDLKFCSAFGKTPEKALSEVLTAQKLWLDAAKETNREIPQARYKPFIYQIAQ
jgi:predicted RNase H-like HicB family nuclease